MARAVATLVTSLGLIAVGTASADAASTRAEYVAQAEAVCAAPSPQILKILKQEGKVIKQARDLTPSEYAVRMGRLLGRLATIEGRILSQLWTIPPAPGDEVIIAQWLQGSRDGWTLLLRAVRAGKHGNLGQMLARLKRSISVTTQAEQPVASFGFQACDF